MRSGPATDVAALLPHSGEMVLIERVLAYDAEQLEALALIGEAHVFLQPDRTVPLWLAVEIMAQGIAALDGCLARDAGRPVRPGFLLGSRRLKLHADRLPVGSQLRVHVRASTQDGQGFGVFDCRLDWLNPPEAVRAQLPEGRILAEGSLNVFQPAEHPGGNVSA